MAHDIKFIQGNGQIERVHISESSKKKFGSFGFMWIVSFDDGTSHYMDQNAILENTGIDMLKRGGIYNKNNQEIINGQREYIKPAYLFPVYGWKDLPDDEKEKYSQDASGAMPYNSNYHLCCVMTALKNKINVSENVLKSFDNFTFEHVLKTE